MQETKNMTKKLLITLFIIALFASCGTRRTAVQVQDPATFDEGIVINGIRWATRNVGMPSTFSTAPEDAGTLYLRGRRIETGKRVWAAILPTDRMWRAVYNPCPPGWRVPTVEEARTLRETPLTRTTRDGIFGALSGTTPYQIFRPLNRGRDTIYWTYGQPLIGDLSESYRYNIHNYAEAPRGFIRCVSIN